jgi:hypothetical protein
MPGITDLRITEATNYLTLPFTSVILKDNDLGLLRMGNDNFELNEIKSVTLEQLNTRPISEFV